MEKQIQNIRKEIITFLMITFALSTVFYILIITGEGLMAQGGLYALGLMWCPGIAALLTRFIFQRNLRGLGWSWGKTRYQVLAYFLPMAYIAISYTLVWLLGLGEINQEIADKLNIVTLFSFAILAVLGSCISAMGEEIGWRGLLIPQLTKITTFTKASVICGVIWIVWHYPLIIFADYHSNQLPTWYALLCFSIFVMGINFAFNWLRLKSGSLWTAVIFHGAQNAYAQNLFDPLTADTGITEYIITEFGAMLALAGVIVGWLFWRKRAELPETRTLHVTSKGLATKRVFQQLR